MIVADTAAASRVFGVHGADGLTYWKCLARRIGTAGTLEAAEWAAIPPGGVSGVHVHTRTEEMYLILSGIGELSLDGIEHPVAPGSLALTRVGSRHGLRNTGAGMLEWLVIEMSAPATHAVLTGSAAAHTYDVLARRRVGVRSRVFDLAETGTIDPGGVLDGPLSVLEVFLLEPGQSRTLLADETEHVVFVLGGAGTAEGAGGSTVLHAGTAVTLPLGGRVELRAEQTLRLFHAALRVSAPDASGTVDATGGWR